MKTLKTLKTLKTQKPNAQRLYRNSAACLLAALAAVACSGCAVGPDFQRPAAPAVDSYTRAPLLATMTSADMKVDSQWWTAFGSPALNALVERAFQHNPGIDSAQAALRQAQENTAAQWGSYFPTIQAGYSPSRQKNAVGTISPTLTSGAPLYTLHTAQLSISYAPDVFGLNRRTVESLAAQEETQRFQLQAAYLTLASNVVAAAIQQAALSGQIHATEGVIAAAARSLAALRQQAELGFASQLDVATQEAALAQAQQSLPPLTKQLEQTRNLLTVLTGSFPAQGGIDDIALDALHLPSPLPLSLPSQLVQQRPDVRAAEAQMHAASAEVGVATANRLPQISLSALYGGSATQFSKMFSNDNKFWGLTGNVTQTVFDFGSLQHRQRAADAALEQANAQYRSVVLSAFQNVADTLYALDADTKTLSAAVASEAATRKTLAMTQKQLDLGFVNALVLLNAEQAYQQAQIARIQAVAMRYTDTAAMYQALGGG